MGRGQRATKGVVAQKKHLKDSAEWLQTIRAALSLFNDEEDDRPSNERLINFFSSPLCPPSLRDQALVKAQYLLDHQQQFENEQLSKEDDLRYQNEGFFFMIFDSKNIAALLKSAAHVSPENQQIITATTAEVYSDLMRRKYLLPTAKATAIPISYTRRDEDTQALVVPYGQYIPIVGAVMISEHLIGNEALLRKIAAHELIHGNEVVRDFVTENKFDKENFPELEQKQRIFLREGLVDWLANQAIMGSPEKHPAPGDKEEWQYVRKYQPNIEFIQAHVVRPLLASLADDELLEDRVLACLRNPPGQTLFSTAFREVPSLREELGKLTDLPEPTVL